MRSRRHQKGPGPQVQEPSQGHRGAQAERAGPQALPGGWHAVGGRAPLLLRGRGRGLPLRVAVAAGGRRAGSLRCRGRAGSAGVTTMCHIYGHYQPPCVKKIATVVHTSITSLPSRTLQPNPTLHHKLWLRPVEIGEARRLWIVHVLDLEGFDDRGVGLPAVARLQAPG